MDALFNLLLLLLILTVLVLLHELGHFITARMAGVTVHEFGIGFPPRARVLFKRGDTTYTLNWLPIGGFVRMEGEERSPADGTPDEDGDEPMLEADSADELESLDPHAFVNPIFIHLPYTTVYHLWRFRPDVVVSGQLGLASVLAAIYCLLRRDAALVLWLTLSEVSELSRGWVRRRLRGWLLARADAAWRAGEPPIWWRDDTHWNPRGHAAVAELLSPHLEAQD